MNIIKSALLFLLIGVAVYEVISVALLIIDKIKAKRAKNAKNDK